MKSLKSRPTTTTGSVPTTMRCARRADGSAAGESSAGKRRNHRGYLAPEVDQDRGQRADVQGHVEGQPEIGRHLPAEERARQNQVGGARDRQKLGQSLHDPEQDGRCDTHGAGSDWRQAPRRPTDYDARRRPGFRVSGLAATT